MNREVQGWDKKTGGGGADKESFRTLEGEKNVLGKTFWDKSTNRQKKCKEAHLGEEHFFWA